MNTQLAHTTTKEKSIEKQNKKLNVFVKNYVEFKHV